jgi:hypothetical protein
VLHLANGEFELRIIDSDGIERVETFTSATELAKRQQAIHEKLAVGGWTRSGEWLL